MHLHLEPATIGATPLQARPRMAELEALLTPPAWFADAACKEHQDLDWFPGKGETPRRQLKVCASCLVRLECLEYALADKTTVGIWGGSTATARRRLRAVAA